MTKKFNQYLGKAGHLATMAEFLILGWNVAIPEVDIGDDIFVVQDDEGTLRRVQVKTSTATMRNRGFSGMFSVSERNLRTISNILVHYVFLVRLKEEWSLPVIIRQDYLLEHCASMRMKSNAKGNYTFYFTYDKGKVTCGKADFTNYVRDYSDFPMLPH